MNRSRPAFEAWADRLLDPPDEGEPQWCSSCREWWDACSEDERCPACGLCDVCGLTLDEYGSGTCDDCARHACRDCDETLAPLVAVRCAECVTSEETA